MKAIDQLVRPHLKKLKPYSSARDEFDGQASVWLDANENAFGSVVPVEEAIHRYPDPMQWESKRVLAQYLGLAPEQIFLGNGSDEIIELMVRVFCQPGQDAIISLPPTFPMYHVAATMHQVEDIQVPLGRDWSPDVEAIKEAVTDRVKIIFLCSPNNPTGNVMPLSVVEDLLNSFKGIVVVDEAYIEFAPEASAMELMEKYSRLVVTRTFSKAWGLAAARVGMALGHERVIHWMNAVKPPYNLNELSQGVVKKALGLASVMQSRVNQLVDLRQQLRQDIEALGLFKRVFDSEANFILVTGTMCQAVYEHLLAEGVVVRMRKKLPHHGDGLRITVGTAAENEALLAALRSFEG